MAADILPDVFTPLLSKTALPRLLALGAAVRAQIQSRSRLISLHSKRPWPAIPPAKLLHLEGGWYATIRVPRTHSEEEYCLRLLEEKHVLIQPGFFYDFQSEAYLVASLLPPEDFTEAMRRLARISASMLSKDLDTHCFNKGLEIRQ